MTMQEGPVGLTCLSNHSHFPCTHPYAFKKAFALNLTNHYFKINIEIFILFFHFINILLKFQHSVYGNEIYLPSDIL